MLEDSHSYLALVERVEVRTWNDYVNFEVEGLEKANFDP